MFQKILRWLRTIYLSPFILMMQGGGSNSSESSSRPLTAGEMTERFAAGVQNIGGSAPGLFSRETVAAQGDPYIWQADSPYGGAIWGSGDQSGGGRWVANPNYVPERSTYALKDINYEAPAYADPGAAQTLTDGDYEKLYNDVYAGNVKGLDYSRDRALQGVNNDAAKRGIWSSGLVMQGEKDLENAYAPAYAKAGGDATSLTMNLKSGELKNLNDYALANSSQKNSVEMENALRKYNARWQPANFLKDIWNGSGGTVSSGSGGGWNFSI